MDGRAVVERLLADPPRVHEELHAPPDVGVWLTERECYELIADRVTPGARTLETGLGVSTALFLAVVEFLDADPRWRGLAHTDKWAAFERLSEGVLAEDWYDQPFYSGSLGLRAALARAWRARRGRRLFL